MRNTSGFAQKNCAKLFSFHEQKFAKNTTGFAQIAQNRAKLIAFMRKNNAKVRKKKICANFAQILRKKYRHFVETLKITFLVWIILDYIVLNLKSIVHYHIKWIDRP